MLWTLLLPAVDSSAAIQPIQFDFNRDPAGGLPGGWSQAQLGEGQTRWEVVKTEEGQVLAQLAGDNPNRHFNMAVVDGIEPADAVLTVRFRALSGREDQGGGLIWRYRDEQNHYIVRANPLENNVVLYKMVDGVRTDLPLLGAGRTYGIKVPALGNRWHELKLKATGSEFTFWLDSRRLFQVRDATFSGPGRVGVWTKADAVTWFDDFTAEPLSPAARRVAFSWSNPAVNGPEWIRDSYILRLGDRYYLTGTRRNGAGATEAEKWPGFHLWSSDDLQHWQEEGQVISNEQVRWSDRNFWAPEVRWHPTKRKFYYCFNARQTNETSGLRLGMGLAVADRITGPYTLLTPDAPITDNNDASLFFDDDGRDYVVQTGFNLAQIDLDSCRLVGEKRKVFSGGDPGEWDDVAKINEGSTLLKVNGTYYYFWSCNSWGYFVGYATATNIWGPYTKNPHNPIWGASKPEFRRVAGQHADFPFTEVGHGTPFLGPDGRLWITGHGHVIGGGAPHPYDSPRVCIDTMDYDPATGRFWSGLSIEPQTIRFDPQSQAVIRARNEPLGSVLTGFGRD